MTFQCMDTTHQTKILSTAAPILVEVVMNMNLYAIVHSNSISSVSYWPSVEQCPCTVAVIMMGFTTSNIMVCVVLCKIRKKVHNLYVILDLFSECRLNLLSSWCPICLHWLPSADIDECASSAYCPDNSSCANQPGSFECFCDRGYIMQNGLCAGEVHTPAPPPLAVTLTCKCVTLIFRHWWMCGQPLSLWGPEVCQHWRRLPVWLLPRVHEGWHGHVHRWDAY